MNGRATGQPLAVTETLAEAPGPRLRANRCRASMVLRNAGDERVVIRSAEVRDLDGLRGAPGETFDVRVLGLLRSGASARIPIRFEVPPTAAPGSYRFDVTVGDVQESMTLQVAPHPQLRLSPSVVLVTGSGHSSRLVIAENGGNLDLSLAGVIAAPLDDELIMCRSLRGALSLFDELDEAEIDVDRLVVRAAKTAGTALAHAILGVRFVPDDEPLLPGASTRLVVEIDTPTTLDPRGRYVAIVPVLTTTLTVVVVPTKVGGITSPPVPGQPAARAAAKKATKRNSTKRN
ncbi:hypothetical protein AB0H36_41860 [Kribbella sp. NPDC050820]|uniref:hypothetical protein n=1 Tax=Kribbella sp. NPDC050820 TaxID=3155408 RepID=UPI0033E83E71